MPMLAHRRHNALLDRPPTRAAYRDAHLVVTPQTVQFALYFTRIAVQFRTAKTAICHLYQLGICWVSIVFDCCEAESVGFAYL
jgi:hypothetical protein